MSNDNPRWAPGSLAEEIGWRFDPGAADAVQRLTVAARELNDAEEEIIAVLDAEDSDGSRLRMAVVRAKSARAELRAAVEAAEKWGTR